MKSLEYAEKIFLRYNISSEEKEEILSIIKPIITHNEFLKRCEENFAHHGKVTAGEHILDDAILAYKLSKKKKNVDIERLLKISLFHDLYTIPWQNNGKKYNSFFHLHGFTHPIEAAINSLYWFNDLFNDDEKDYLIIDGIIHHMFPFPVASFKNIDNNILELNNYEIIKHIPNKYLNMIETSSNRKRIGKISFSKSITKEGRIMASADKRTMFIEFSNISDLTALISRKNKRLK